MKLFSNDLTAVENMYIPGGKIWIDSVEVPVDDNAWSGKADIAEDTSNYAKKTRDVPLASGLQVFEGTLLVYQKNGYPSQIYCNDNYQTVLRWQFSYIE